MLRLGSMVSTMSADAIGSMVPLAGSASIHDGRFSTVKCSIEPPLLRAFKVMVFSSLSFLTILSELSLHLSWLRSMYALHVIGESISLPFLSRTPSTVKFTIVFSMRSYGSLRVMMRASLFTTKS